MKNRSFSIQVSTSIGKVSAKYLFTEKSKCMMTLAHGAGAGMDHPFMENLAEALAAYHISTLRFNFPFTEAGKRRPDVPAVAHKTIEAAIQKAYNVEPSLPIVSAGKSFGGRMTSQYLAANPGSIVRGIIFYGFPLHPAGKPSMDRAAHLKEIKLPMLFLQGSRDALASPDLVEPLTSSMSNTKLIEFEGADHSFKSGKNNNIDLLAKATDEWIEKVLNNEQ